MRNKSIIIDTRFIYALYSKNDSNHKQAKEIAAKFSQIEWLTTCFVFQELFWLFSDPLQVFEAEKRGVFQVVDFDKSHFYELEKITKKYSDREIDLADASLIFLAEQLGHGNIISTDIKDFSVYRWGRNNSFHNLLI